MSNTYSQSDVASHNKADSLLIVVDGDVYDLTKFQDDHPGELTVSYALRAGIRAGMMEGVHTVAGANVNHRRQEDPPESCRQGCVQAVLEVSQRGNSQKVQEAAPDRLARHKAEAGCRADTRSCATEGHQEAGAQGRTPGRIRIRRFRGIGALRCPDPIC